ncbi:Coenzyme F420 hydrogenase/dehydrogenase, beta subunit C-terminal domain [Clostridium sp. AWRP]|uniref:Coenzyme F420 hydrogenase/dehydrogenase, beta subunit C-terminal domain n=1 Tax=Clostridium sp. AWRP TaxID=2212991 RepID=UPI000FDA297E|nr:Coenzyme F420 hydrogenase/dehydrogenase, beta subunit C-terminal domain [Clostridium sp. AWRP]AZV55537.1 4Fe-4S dicluster domain-containing protein [Clostridium sp. AWRP]
MKICDDSSCTGCMMCIDICNQKAISAVEDEQGFMHPSIDSDKCVECGLCVSRCPVNYQKKNKKAEKVFACWQKNVESRLASTSGGAFLTIAERIIQGGGVVYGAAFDDLMRVKHIRTLNMQEVKKLRGSKYVQSNTKNIYEQVKNDLKVGRKVLFSGTPCQVAALQNYLKINYENLFFIDIVCHGVPSPMIFRDYLKCICEKNHSKITELNFRYKKPCWSVFSMKAKFKNGSEYIASKFKDPYLHFFLLRDLTLRKSCFECHFSSPERTGDITLADFWNYRAYKFSQRGSERGVNLVLTNTKKGEQLLCSLASELHIEEHTWKEAFESNKQLLEPNKKPVLYDNFWGTYRDGGFRKVREKYYYYNKRYEILGCLYAWKKAHAYLITAKILKAIKKKA